VYVLPPLFPPNPSFSSYRLSIRMSFGITGPSLDVEAFHLASLTFCSYGLNPALFTNPFAFRCRRLICSDLSSPPLFFPNVSSSSADIDTCSCIIWSPSLFERPALLKSSIARIMPPPSSPITVIVLFPPYSSLVYRLSFLDDPINGPPTDLL